jgi:uncharacterized protein with von Willebrand factor type A (vWA) domain
MLAGKGKVENQTSNLSNHTRSFTFDKTTTATTTVMETNSLGVALSKIYELVVRRCQGENLPARFLYGISVFPAFG